MVDKTKNKVSFDASDEEVISSVVVIDGLGREIKRAKYGEKTERDGRSKEGWNVSGKKEYDGKGRVIKEGQDYFVEGVNAEELVRAAEKSIHATETEYDGLDRIIKVVLPDESEQKTVYRIEGGKEITESIDPLGNKTEYGIKNGKTYTLVTDPEGNKTKQEKDARENIVSNVINLYMM